MCIPSGRRLAVAAFVVWAFTPFAARAQFITDVNSVISNEYHFFCCTSNLTVTNNYPTSVVVDDQYTSTSGGIHFANRHDLIFSSDNGATARKFNTADSFDISYDIRLEAGATSPRKEAGLIIDQSIGGSQFIVNTDGTDGTGPLGGEIVVFGGFQPFFSFNNTFGISYNAGETINMRMIYTGKTATANGAFQYIVKKDGTTYTSPVLTSDAGEMGIANNSNLEFYVQGKAATASDFERATFSNIVFGTGAGVPGDYNNNGKVDAADYVVWRKTPASYGGDPDGYTTWRSNFGNPPASASGLESIGVPEPAGGALLVFAATGIYLWRRPTAKSV